MAVKCVPLVAETISTKPNATGTFTLSGADPAVPGARTVTSQYADGEQLIGRVQNADASMFEEATYQFTATGTTLARVSVTHSSNSNASVDFSGSATALVFTTSLLAQSAQDSAQLSETTIQGLRLNYVSTTSISVDPGFAYVQSLGKLLVVPSTLTASSLSLSASTWYYVYLYNNAGTAAIEVSSTAPATAYSGKARTKTSDTSRRFLGSFFSKSDSTVQGFTHNLNRGLMQFGGPNSSLVRPLSGGSATTDTTFSCSAGFPPQTSIGLIKIINTNTVANLGVAKGGTTDAYNNANYKVETSFNMVTDMPCDTSQQLTYKFNATPSGGFAYIDILGYYLER